MPLDPGFASIADRVALLNDRYRHHAAVSVLEHALGDEDVGRTALVSSFGAESVVLLHMISVIDRTLPVLFIDTEMLFAETLAYQQEVAERLSLTNIITVKADPTRLAFEDPDDTLHQFNTDACCALRKTEPLERALSGYDAWITGRKRYQGAARASVDFFEAEGDLRIKVNPLAHWGKEDLIRTTWSTTACPATRWSPRATPRSAARPAPARSSRARTSAQAGGAARPKSECGIHFINGRPCAAPSRRKVRHERDRHRYGFAPETGPGPFATLPTSTRRVDVRRASTSSNTDDPCAPVEPPRRHRVDPHCISGLQRRARLYACAAAARRWATRAGCVPMAR